MPVLSAQEKSLLGVSDPGPGGRGGLSDTERVLLGFEEAPPEQGEFAKGLGRGVKQTQALVQGGTAAVASLLGAEEFAQRRMEDYDQLIGEASAKAPAIARVEDIEDFGDFVQWSAGMLGEQVPVVASFIVSGGVGGLLGRMAAKKLITKGTRELVESRVKSMSRRSALAGAGGFAGTIEAGGIFGEQREAGLEPSPGLALGGGAISGALELLPVVTVARGLGLGPAFTSRLMRNITSLPRARRAAAFSALVAGQEAGTEALQEVVALTAREIADTDYEALGEEGRSRLLNAAAGGGIVGAVFGGVGGAVARRAEAQEPDSALSEMGVGALQRDAAVVEEAGTVPPSIPPFDLIRAPPPSPAKSYVEAFGLPEESVQRVQREIASGLLDIENGVRDDAQAPAIARVNFVTGEGENLILFQEAGHLNPAEGLEENILLMDPSTRTPADAALAALTGRKRVDMLREAIDELRQTQTEEARQRVEALRQTVPEAEARAPRERLRVPSPTGEELLVVPLRPGTQVTIVDEARSTPTIETRVEPDATEGEIAALRPTAEVVQQAKAPTIPTTLREGLLAEGIDVTRLSEREQSRTLALMEKEDEQGLSQREYTVLEKLLAKGSGESAAERMTAGDRKELEALATTTLKEETARRRTAKAARVPIAEAEEIAAIEEFRSKRPGAPEIALITQETARIQRGVDPRVMRTRGWVDTRDANQVYVVSGRHGSKADLLRTLLHETLVHSGFRKFLTPAEINRVLSLTAQSVDLGLIMNEYGLDSTVEGDRLFAAEEYIARIAEDGSNPTLLDKIVALVRRAIRAVNSSLRFTDGEIKLLLSDLDVAQRTKIFKGDFSRKTWGLFQDRDTLTPSNVYQTRVGSEIAQTFDRLAPELSGEGAEAARDIDRLGGLWNQRMLRWFLTPLQISKHVELGPIQRYMSRVEEWWNTKTAIMNSAEQVITDWRQMAKEKANLLSRGIFEISTESDAAGRRFTRPEVDTKLLGMGFDEELLNFYHRIDDSFGTLLSRLEAGLKRSVVIESLRGIDPDVWLQEYEESSLSVRTDMLVEVNGEITIGPRLAEIERDFDLLKNRNYFPRTRFGRYTVVSIATRDTEYEGRRVREGEALSFETYESRTAQSEGFARVKEETKSAGGAVKMGKLQDTEFAFLGLPPSLMESIKGELQLNPAQREALKEIFIRLSPGRAFLRHLIRRKGVPGFSVDAMRVYATYMLSSANHIARVEHHTDMQRELSKLDSLAKLQDPETGEDLGTETRDATALGETRDYFRRHFDYIMNPGNDFAAVRAMGFMFYLGANPKSAFVNMTQVPMVTYPYLAARHGDTASVGEIAKAYKSVVGLYRGKSDVSVQESNDLQRATSEGFIDESLATELAGIAESPALFRMLPEGTGHKTINQMSYYGSWMFHQAEKFNRRVAFLAGLRLARAKGLDSELSYQAGKETVQATQFEYAKWNRAEFMRGKKSVVFLFWQYMQHASFLAFGGEGANTAMRFWLMLLMLAGVQGLPFAENLMDLFDLVAEKLKRSLGIEDARTEIREDLREVLGDFIDNPDWVMHGLGRYYGLGPLHLLGSIGVPVPNTDVSGSLSLGRVVPGIEDLAGHERDPDKKLARTLVEAGGPVVSIGYNLWRLMTEENPDTWKSWERTMPSIMKAGSKAIRWSVRGEETARSGATIHDFEDMPGRANSITETLLRFSTSPEALSQAAGFGQTELNKEYELRAAQEEARRYYLTRRALLLQNLGYAFLTKDREGVADSRRKIKEFNQRPPHPDVRITRDEIKRSMKQRSRAAIQRELGIPHEKMLRRIYSDIGENFEQER